MTARSRHMTNLIHIDEASFERRFKPFLNHLIKDNSADHGIYYYETYGAELAFIQTVLKVIPNCVWTVLDTDSGLITVSGFHHINRFAYILSEMPWTENIEVIPDIP